MTDSTLKTMTMVHRVWAACVMDITHNPEANRLFTKAVVAKLTENALISDEVGNWAGVPSDAFAGVLSEAEKANHEFQESASALCDMLQTDLIHSYELVHRDVVKTVLSAILYKVAIRKAE